MKFNKAIKHFFKNAFVILLPAFNLQAQERIIEFDFEKRFHLMNGG